ncbi:MAG: hypothetical protein LUD77_02130 [Clostridiales bacterium]|nr:hypothetical protein [Clostridiales bacterium]
MKFKRISAIILAFVLVFADINLMFAGELYEEGEVQNGVFEEEEIYEEVYETEEGEEESSEDIPEETDSEETKEEPAEDETENIEEEITEEETVQTDNEKADTAETETEETTEETEDSGSEDESDIIYIDRPFEYDLSWSSDVFTYADLADSSSSEESASYASMLSDSEKKIYNAVESKMNTSGILSGIKEKTFSFSNGVSFTTPMLQVDVSTSSIGVNMTVDSAGSYWDSISDAGLAYIYDNSDEVWICNFTASVSASNRRISTIHYYFFSTSDYSSVSSDITAFDSWAGNVLSEASPYSSYYEKLKYMHDSLCNQTSYNYSSLLLYFGDESFRYTHAASGIVVLNNQVVCEGYAKAYKYLCDQADIPCLIITSTDHMWNVVQMEDGEWYGVDCTWDDGSSISHSYFLKGTAVFEDHSYTNPFSFDLAYGDYEYTTTTTETTTETTTQAGYIAPPSFTVAGVFGGRTVTFSSITDGAVIYYSSESSALTVNDSCVSNGETVLFEDFYGTIYARTYYKGK